MNINTLQKLTKLIRYYILTMTTAAGSGHTTSSLSAVELMTTLFFGGFFRADLDNPQNPGNDRLIFSKGHASPLFYSLYAAAGKLTVKDLEGYRKFDSPLEGHPTLEFPYTEAPTGSLGQGLPIGLGMVLALRAKFREAESGRRKVESKNSTSRFTLHASRLPMVYVLLGDGEMAEGSVWEAIQVASYYKIDNLMVILDVNRLGQSQPTMLEHDLATYQKRFAAFGWKTVVVKNGHDINEICRAYKNAVGDKNTSGVTGWSGNASQGSPDGEGIRKKPVVIIAKTFKGYGIKLLQNKDNWHGKPLPKDLYEQALKDLGKVDLEVRGEVAKPITNYKLQITNKIQNPKSKITYKLGDAVATRQAAGDALTALMYKYQNVVCLDGDVKNSLFTESTQKEHPKRYFEMFIAEQNMVGAAIGLARRGFIPFVTTFSAFLTRAYDQIRMAALGTANIKFIGSHAGVSIGEDGASQMGLEDLAMFRSAFGSTVLYPADAVSSQKLVEEMIKRQGICYLRVARPTTPVIYDDKEKFPIGGAKVHKSPKSLKSLKKKVMIIAAGITLYEALKTQEILAEENIETIVVDCYSIKPIDAATITKLSSEFPTILTVEDHWFEGGLGDAVLNVFSSPANSSYSSNPPRIYKLAVTKMPHSGKPGELLDFEGISAKTIVRRVREII